MSSSIADSLKSKFKTFNYNIPFKTPLEKVDSSKTYQYKDDFYSKFNNNTSNNKKFLSPSSNLSYDPYRVPMSPFTNQKLIS